MVATYAVFYGFVEAWPISFPGDKDNIVQLTLVDGFKMLSLASVSGDFVQQTSGQRVGAILDAVGWPSADRVIETGVATVPAITLTNVSALQHIQDIEHAEGGRFFIGKDGKANFQDRAFPQISDFSTRTWADDGTGMSYRDLVLEYSDSLILNDIHMTRTGGIEQTAFDAASHRQYGLRTLAETDLQLSDDGQVSTRANTMLSRYKQPSLRLESLVDNAMKHGLWDRVLVRDINDPIKVIESKTNTAQISSIEGIDHEVGVDTWTVTLRVAPAIIEQIGILDDSTFGLLDSTFYLGS